MKNQQQPQDKTQQNVQGNQQKDSLRGQERDSATQEGNFNQRGTNPNQAKQDRAAEDQRSSSPSKQSR